MAAELGNIVTTNGFTYEFLYVSNTVKGVVVGITRDYNEEVGKITAMYKVKFSLELIKDQILVEFEKTFPFQQVKKAD